MDGTVGNDLTMKRHVTVAVLLRFLLQVVAAVLHLLNVQFQTVDIPGQDVGSKVFMASVVVVVVLLVVFEVGVGGCGGGGGVSVSPLVVLVLMLVMLVLVTCWCWFGVGAVGFC